MKKFLKIFAAPFFVATLFCSLVISIIVFIAWMILPSELAFELETIVLKSLKMKILE